MLLCSLLGWLPPHTQVSTRQQPRQQHRQHVVIHPIERGDAVDLAQQQLTLNRGCAIDTLNRDHPLFFTAKPDLSIFDDRITLIGESGPLQL